MARGINGLMAKAKEIVPPTRKIWFDALTVEQQEEVNEVLTAMREGKLDRTASAIARLIIDTYGLKCSQLVVRLWIAEQLRGGRVAKKT